MAFPNRCVNCYISFDNPRIVSRGVLALQASLRDLLMSWISPMEIIPEHKICEKCVVILQSQAQVDQPTRDYGHKSICIGCGVSVLRAKSIAINNRHEFTIIRGWVPQIQADLPILTRVCRVCWRRATRAHATSIARQAEDILPDVSIKIEDAEMPLHVSISVEVVEDPLRPPTPPPLPIPLLEPKQEVKPQRQTLALPNYKRVASTSRRCIFSDCLNVEKILRLIPKTIRQRVLLDINIYIPRCTRICSNHLFANNWRNLENEHLINNFTSEHVEDMIFLSQNNQGSQMDFENIESMDDHTRHYWIGITVQQFYEIINSSANLITRIHKYKTALAMYLAKLRTGESDARLSTIFGVAKSTMNRNITIVKECLNQDNVKVSQ